MNYLRNLKRLLSLTLVLAVFFANINTFATANTLTRGYEKQVEQLMSGRF